MRNKIIQVILSKSKPDIHKACRDSGISQSLTDLGKTFFRDVLEQKRIPRILMINNLNVKDIRTSFCIPQKLWNSFKEFHNDGKIDGLGSFVNFKQSIVFDNLLTLMLDGYTYDDIWDL